MHRLLGRAICFVLSACVLATLCIAPSYAVNAGAFISGTVTLDGRPAAHVAITASGNNLVARTVTDAKGRFSFPPLALGTYDVEARAGDLRGIVRVDLGSGGASIFILLKELKQIAHAVVTQSQSLTVHGSGSDVVLNNTAFTRLPFDNNFTQMEAQMPGAAQGADGVVHINGDHGVINYVIDGVPLPQELNRDIGSEIDISNLSFVDLIEGAYPAQYGLKFGAVFNMSSRAGTGPAGFDGYASAGSYTDAQTSIGYHAPLPGGGGYDIALSGLATTRGLDPIGTPRITMRVRPASSPASRCRPAETTSPILRFSTVTIRFKFPTTSPTANQAIPTTTKRRPTPFSPSSFITRWAIRERLAGARRITSREFKISATRITIGSTANRST